MSNPTLQTLQKITSDPTTPGQQWLTPYAGDQETLPHQFVLFFKPECTALQAGVNVEAILDLFHQTLEKWEIQTGAVRIMRGDYLKQHRLLDRHYGVINDITHKGREAISQSAEKKLQDTFADELDSGAQVMGAYPFLENYPEISPFALSIMSINGPTVKLAGGTYALSLDVAGTTYILLNAFHPYQLVPYYDPQSAIVVLACSSDHPWADLRTKLAGATNPESAVEGSIRNQILQQKAALNMANVSSSANGIHLSAGPLEGMVEIQRFFADHEKEDLMAASKTSFGRLLEQHGISSEEIDRLATNPDFEIDGQLISAFDLTEEVDATEAAKKLSAQIPQLVG